MTFFLIFFTKFYIKRIHLEDRKYFWKKKKKLLFGYKKYYKKKKEKRKKKERLNKINTPLPQRLFLNNQTKKKKNHSLSHSDSFQFS